MSSRPSSVPSPPSSLQYSTSSSTSCAAGASARGRAGADMAATNVAARRGRTRRPGDSSRHAMTIPRYLYHSH
ncbi:unnamed protein product [Mycena citricolor]|uniref:Uncharacterized protein n=1 Tax=Mycena citricolor TaxID=2018698 RepID=A0AAD2HLF5_9AGAR|nr:unnamed protein product [Mycena citricolor]